MKGALFSKPDESQVGSFHYPLGLVDFSLSDGAHEIVKRISDGGAPVRAEDGDEETLLRLAYEVTSFCHEMRHFVDTFGTMAGISLFSSRLQRLKEFAALGTAFRAAGQQWRLPITQWAEESDCPKAARNFVRRMQAFDAGSEIYLAPFAPIEVDGHLDDLKVEVDYQAGGSTDAFPLRMARVGQDGTERLRTVLFPLGVETLMEGNAHAVCRTLVGQFFPKAVADRLQLRYRIIAKEDTRGEPGQRAAQTTTPYIISDLLVSRSLRKRGITTFPRDLVLALTDRVLIESSIRLEEPMSGATAMHVDRVGAKLVEILESEDAGQLASGTVPDHPDERKIYEGFLAAFESGGDWQSVTDDGSAGASIAIWESYVAKTFIVPLLRERVQTANRAFRTHSGFMKLLQKIGVPPVRVANRQLMVGSMPPRVQQAWWHHLVLGEIVRQLVHGGEHVFCPRAHGTVPGIESMNLALEGDCRKHLRRGCGTFTPGDETFVPKCLFEDALRLSALQR